MPLQSDDVHRLAALAKIAIDENEAQDTLVQLNRVFELIETMQAVDTTGIEPMTHPQLAPLRLRADEVSETDQREALQKPAPQTEKGLFLVPRVIE